MKKRILSMLAAAALTASMLPAGIAAQAEQAAIYGWTATVKDPASASCTLDTMVYCVGEHAACLEGTTDQSSAKIQTELRVEQGKSYRVRFWAKAVGASDFTCTIGNNKRSLLPVVQTYDWTAFDFVYTHVEDSVSAVLSFDLNKRGTVYIDEVYVELDEAGKQPNLVANPGFETEGQTELSDELQPYTAVPLDQIIGEYADKSAMPLLYGESIVLDADLSEWDGYSAVSLPQGGGGVSTISGYQGAADLSATFKAAYDDEYLYLSCAVTDDAHSQNNPEASTYWRGDSIQMVLGTAEEDYGMEIGFYLTDGGEAKVYSAELEKTEWGAVDPKVLELREKTKVAAAREGTVTYYEMQIPWEIKFDGKPDEFLMNLLVNDNDGSGRKGYMEWTEGIGQTKSNEKFAALYPVAQGYDVFGYVDGPKSMYEQAEEQYELYVFNMSDEDQAVTIQFEDGTEQEAQIPANSAYLAPATVTSGMEEEKEIAFPVSAEGKSYTARKTVPVKKNLQLAFPAFETEQLAELKELVAECEAKNLPVDYEKIDVTTIERFIGYGLEDLHGGRTSRAEYVYDCLVQLYEEAKAQLTAYLDGTAEPTGAVYYTGGEPEIQGQTFIADTVNTKTGETAKAPVFFSGYLDASRESLEISQVGANLLQFEVSMSGHISSADSVRGWQISRQGGAQGTYTYADDTAQSGVYSMKISNSSGLASNVYCNLTQKVTLEAGKTYTLSFYAKADGANGCSFRPDGWNLGKNDISGTYDWKKFTYEYNPTETAEVELMFMSENVTNALYIDNVRIVEKGTKNNLIQHGSFEEQPVIINGYAVNVDRFQRETVAALDEAQRNNVAVDVLMSVHYFPTNLLPEEDWQSNQTGFVKYNIYSDETKAVIEAFLKGLIPEIANHPALNSICISNEPTYRIGRDASNAPAWQAYLRELYQDDVALMNETWHENFESFEAVPLAETYENLAMYYDYLRFNDKMFAEWHAWMAGMIREIAPDVPLHAKIMSVVNQTESTGADQPIVRGTDPELFAQFTDLNGNDAWNFIGSSRTMLVKNLWYDLLTSIKNVPVFNSEDHVIEDRDERYTSQYAPHIATDIWQGALHGRSATTMWKWDRSLLTTDSASGNIKHRPDAVALTGKAMLDLNRLGAQMQAMQQVQPEVALYYSYPSRVYSQTHMNGVYKAYEAISYNGQRTKIVTEQMLAQDQLTGVKLLVVPNVVSTTPETLEGIKRFIENGGKVLTIGECFAYDVHQNPFENQETVQYILSQAQQIEAQAGENPLQLEPAENLGTAIWNAMNALGMCSVELIDAETGARVSDTEWCYTEYDGGLLLNLCLYDWDAGRSVVVKVNGTPVSGALELRSGETLAETFQVEGYTPMLLQIKQ